MSLCVHDPSPLLLFFAINIFLHFLTIQNYSSYHYYI
nr:MAG TPA: hypothetical protein [Caudoviricetes sp.]DAZ84003.1 MAG TPA: hypothetical protein [Caudoviricetes sp.]